MIDLRDLQNLISLDEHRHFSRAAVAVGLSQPALTKSIQRLEKQLGGLLFDRSRSGIKPTSIGIETLARAKKIVGEVIELQRSADLFNGLMIGAVTIGVGPAMSESYVAAALSAVTEAHPEIQINVRVDHWEQLSRWLLDNEIDFFVADIAEGSSDDRFDCTPLPTQEIVWFCRAGHPLAGRRSVSQNDLLKFPLATPRMPIWAVRWFAAAEEEGDQARRDQPPRDPGNVDSGRQDRAWPAPRPMPNIQCESYSMLKRITLSGNCISAALSATIEPELSEGRLMILPVDAPALTTRAGIVKLRDRSSSPLAKELIRMIRSIADSCAGS